MISSCTLFVTCFLISAFVIPSAFSIKCYVCDANNDSDCRTYLKQTFLQDCKPNEIKHIVYNATGCAIVFSELYDNGKKQSKTNVRRNCYYGNMNSSVKLSDDLGCDELHTGNFIPYNCTVCNEDGCNNIQANDSIKFNSYTFLTLLVIGCLLIFRV